MKTRCGTSQGIAFVDSTPLRVCKNIRIPRHKPLLKTRAEEVIDGVVLWL